MSLHHHHLVASTILLLQWCNGIFIFLVLLEQLVSVNTYSIGYVGPRALRGVWRLTSLDDEGLPFERRRHDNKHQQMQPQQSPFMPMKEFTTYPTDESAAAAAAAITAKILQKKKPSTEIFIKLKEDYTFEQCTALQFSDGRNDEGMNTLEDQLALEVSKRERASFAWKGTWDYIDGKLILAADRPEKKKLFYDDDEVERTDVDGDNNTDSDTILVGRVIVQSGGSLTDNPVMERKQQQQMTLPDDDTDASAGDEQPICKKGKIDVHLSVPKGKVGKFMYPRDHPYFFEQPIIRPQRKGSFELRQILGEFNAKLDDEAEPVELFRKKDLEGKRFYLTTFPLRRRRKKFEYWSKEDNCYKTGEYEPTAAEKAEEELEPGKNMQVMAVELFANKTFTTLYGLGSGVLLAKITTSCG